MGELDDVMTLLAIGIVADGRIANEEVTVFKKAITQIKLSNSEIELPTEEAAITWFTKYQQDIRSIVFGPQSSFENRLKGLLDNLSVHIRPDALIHILQMISIADGEVHSRETQLILFIKHHWHMK